MFFVSDVPNNGQNVLDIMVTKPNRERQKLMREQNILKQVAAHTWGWAGPWPASRTSSIFFFLIYMYSLYFWLCWVFVAAHGCLWLLLGVASLVAEHGLWGVRAAVVMAPGV